MKSRWVVLSAAMMVLMAMSASADMLNNTRLKSAVSFERVRFDNTNQWYGTRNNATPAQWLPIMFDVEYLTDGVPRGLFGDTAAIRTTAGYAELKQNFNLKWTVVTDIRNFNVGQALWSKSVEETGDAIIADTVPCAYNEWGICLRMRMDIATYGDNNTFGGLAGKIVDPGVNLNDGQWHQVVYTDHNGGSLVSGTSIDIWVDKVLRPTAELLDAGRIKDADFLSTDSKIMQLGAVAGVVSGADFDNVFTLAIDVNQTDVDTDSWMYK